MKSSVPGTAKISKEAKECVQECVSEFISFITSEAAEKCQMEKRKTIGGEDILYAMLTLGFENYAETLKIHLAKLRQVRPSFLYSLGCPGIPFRSHRTRRTRLARTHDQIPVRRAKHAKNSSPPPLRECYTKHPYRP